MKSYSFTLLFSAIVLTSCGHENTPNQVSTAPVSVTTATVKGVQASNAILASGQITPVKSANVSTRLMGHIAGFKVSVGDQVRKGQLLVEVSPSDMEAKKAQALAGLAQAEAAYLNAEKDFQRFTSLFQKNSASQKELDNMTTRYEMAKSGLAMAQNAVKEIEAHLEYAFIKAPFSGVVVNTFGKSGDMAFPGMPLITIESEDAMEVIASISESDVSRLKVGDMAEVTVSSANLTFSATLKELSRSSKNTGGQYLAKLNVTEKSELLRSGMFASVRFEKVASITNEEVFVPSSAIVRRGQLNGIYVQAGDKALLRWVRLGGVRGDEVKVLSGLSSGETYIISSEAPLSDGVTISL